MSRDGALHGPQRNQPTWQSAVEHWCRSTCCSASVEACNSPHVTDEETAGKVRCSGCSDLSITTD